MLDWGAGIVVLKLGARGLYLRIGARGIAALPGAGWRERELWAPCFVPEPLVGTTGAGDATIAGFLAGVLRGQPVEAALTSAVAVGACNVEAADALGKSARQLNCKDDPIWSRGPADHGRQVLASLLCKLGALGTGLGGPAALASSASLKRTPRPMPWLGVFSPISTSPAWSNA